MDGLEFIRDSFGQMSGFLTFITIIIVIVAYLAIKFKDDLVELVNRKKDKRTNKKS